MQICHQENAELNINECQYRCTKMSFFGEVVSRKEVQPEPKDLLFPNRNTFAPPKKMNYIFMYYEQTW